VHGTELGGNPARIDRVYNGPTGTRFFSRARVAPAVSKLEPVRDVLRDPK
jgi:hypothetical protein